MILTEPQFLRWNESIQSKKINVEIDSFSPTLGAKYKNMKQ